MAKKSKLELKSRMKNLLMFFPNMVALTARMMVDSRVPRTERALFAAALIYAIIPFDFIPDMMPILGFTDDAAVLATAIRLVARHITPEHRDAARAALKRGIDREG